MDFRREWLEMLVAQCQTFIGHVLTLGDGEDLADTASSWVRALPDPSCPVEDLALCAVLPKFAVTWSAAVHAQAHRSSKRCQNESVTTYGLDQFGGRVGRSAKQSFEGWAHLFSEEFRRTHPRSVAQCAARIIRTAPPARLDIATLADAVGVTPIHLRRVFQRERGLALPEYLRRVRLLCALDVLVSRGGKIEPIAMEVGYRSKKNFYRVFKQLTGLTPTTFRSLPVASARLIVDSTRLALYSGRAS
jgi:AraC-like DNA-binding protein